MREIEFRAWHEGHKSMVFFDWDKVAKDQYQMQHLCELLSGAHSEGTAMQYTGLKDKNGVKIFEGDVVNHDALDACIVVYQDCGFILRVLYHKHRYCGLNGYYLSVIGNIHENPELIGGSK